MKRLWRTRFLQNIADHRRQLLHGRIPVSASSRLLSMCRSLLSGAGDPSSISLADAILRSYSDMGGDDRRAFFELLANQFDADPSVVRAAAEGYLAAGAASSLRRLARAVESPRRELFHRLNMVPHGTAALVAMRADLLEFAREGDALRNVDADLKGVLSSWFNPGFLRLHRIDWNSPASLLEKIIDNESVHVIRGWDDLRRRLSEDRRCYAFFHPALPDTPLVFVEAAFLRGLPRESRLLLDQHAPEIDPAAANTAVFYSINSTQPGLRGLSFGSFLIRRVLDALRFGLPNLRLFATLSPLTGFATTIRAAARDQVSELTPGDLEGLLDDYREALRRASGIDRAVEALFSLLDDVSNAPRQLLDEPLRRLVLAYFSLMSRGHRCVDPVANFHLSNGASLSQINPFADMTPASIEESYGVMVNYRYNPAEMAVNREKFLVNGEIAMSASLSRVSQKLRSLRTIGPVAA